MLNSYREDTREGRVLDCLTSGDLRLIVSRRGAELVSLARRNANGDWIGFLFRDGDLSAPHRLHEPIKTFA
jgi:hypothetical protein